MRIWIILLLLPLTALANRPLYQAWVLVDDVQTVSGGVWRVSGNVSDYSALGYTARDTEAGNLLFAQSDAGIVDFYRVVNVVTTTTQRVTMDVAPATNAWPVSDSPRTGKQILCAISNNAVFIPSFTANQGDEYLVRQAQNLTGFLLAMGSSSVSQTNFPYTAITNAPWLTSLMGAMTNLVLTTNAPSGTTFADGTLNLGTNSPCIFGTGRMWLTDSGGTSTLYHITSGNVTNLIGSFTGL